MVAIVTLNPEEAEIALHGSIAEPSYRPNDWFFPVSDQEGKLAEEPEPQESLDDRHNASLPPGRVIDPSVAFPTSQTLSRPGAAQRWKRSAHEPALLVIPRDGTLQIIALGTVEGNSRASNRGVRHLTIRVRYILRRSIRFDEVRIGLDARQQAQLDDALEGVLRPLSPQLGSSVMTAVSERAPELVSIFGAIQDQLNAERAARAQSRRPRPAELLGEASSSALHFFTTRWYELRPIPDPAPSDFAQELEQLTGRVENDFITDDSGLFPGWDRAINTRGGWWEFRNNGRRLLVKNINVSPQENQTGADLVYVRRNPEAFVLVQYKLLQCLKDGRLIFRPDGRLDSQVARMLALEDMPPGDVSTEDVDSYRIGRGFSFVKFVLSEGIRPDRPGELMPGFYFPSEYARRILAKPDMGPQGGIVYFIDDHRHINPETFAWLVRDNWVGSIGEVTSTLREIFNLRDPEADLVLAIDENIEPAQSTV